MSVASPKVDGRALAKPETAAQRAKLYLNKFGDEVGDQPGGLIES